MNRIANQTFIQSRATLFQSENRKEHIFELPDQPIEIKLERPHLVNDYSRSLDHRGDLRTKLNICYYSQQVGVTVHPQFSGLMVNKQGDERHRHEQLAHQNGVHLEIGTNKYIISVDIF